MQFMHVYISLFSELTIDPIDFQWVNTLIAKLCFFRWSDSSEFGGLLSFCYWWSRST